MEKPKPKAKAAAAGLPEERKRRDGAADPAAREGGAPGLAVGTGRPGEGDAAAAARLTGDDGPRGPGAEARPDFLFKTRPEGEGRGWTGRV